MKLLYLRMFTARMIFSSPTKRVSREFRAVWNDRWYHHNIVDVTYIIIIHSPRVPGKESYSYNSTNAVYNNLYCFEIIFFTFLFNNTIRAMCPTYNLYII